jgi:hypothetical protein
MFFTVPRSTLPSASVSSVVFFFSAFSSSSSALRDSTMLPRFLLTLMTRIRSSCPFSASRFRTGARRSAIREERADADVDCETALDAFDHAADDDLAIGIGLLDLVPDLHLLGLLAREHDVAFTILGPLQQHVDVSPPWTVTLPFSSRNSWIGMRPSDL